MSKRPPLPQKWDIDVEADHTFANKWGGEVAILLDGVEQKRVTSYDVEAGTVTKHKVENGHIQFNRMTGQSYKETLTGKVEVRWSTVPA